MSNSQPPHNYEPPYEDTPDDEFTVPRAAVPLPPNLNDEPPEVTEVVVVQETPLIVPARRAPREIGPLGLPEVIALGAAFILLLTVALAYFLLLLPNRASQEKLERQRTEARAELLRLQNKHTEGETSQQIVERVGQSVTGFERTALSRRDTGRLSFYSLLTELMLRNGVRNTAGPAYADLPAIKPEESGRRNNAAQKGSDRWQSIYPGISVNVTVEGTYANVRRFLHDVEAAGQFVVINGVEVEGSRNQDANARTNGVVADNLPPAASDSQRRGSLVNLRLDLAAYFQRDGIAATPLTPPAAPENTAPPADGASETTGKK